MENTPPEPPKFNMPQVGQPEQEKIPDAPLPSEVKEIKPKRSKKKLLIIFTTILAIVLGVTAIWYFVFKDTDTNQDQQQAAEQQSAASEIVTLGDVDTVPYAFMAGDAAAYSVFWRDAAGGDRTEVGPLAAQSYISQSAVSGQNVAYALENMEGGTGAKAVWLSKDAGKSYEQILKVNTGDQVTSMVFSTDNSALAIAVLGQDAPGNEVRFIDLESMQQTGTYVSDQRGVFLEAYHVGTSEILYYEGCYNCDGNSFSKLNLRNISENTAKVVADAGESSFTHTVVRSDFSEAVVSLGTLNAGAEIGPGAAAPYTIQKVNLGDGTKTDIGSVPDNEVTGLGYQADGITPYYAYGNMVISPVENSDPTTLYQSELAIMNVYYVSKDKIVASTGTSLDFVLNNYDITAAAATTVLSGDGNTTLFGITTQ